MMGCSDGPMMDCDDGPMMGCGDGPMMDCDDGPMMGCDGPGLRAVSVCVRNISDVLSRVKVGLSGRVGRADEESQPPSNRDGEAVMD